MAPVPDEHDLKQPRRGLQSREPVCLPIPEPVAGLRRQRGLPAAGPAGPDEQQLDRWNSRPRHSYHVRHCATGCRARDVVLQVTNVQECILVYVHIDHDKFLG
jgi:hypothetical protein